ncbi:MAG: non-canonical purine NTP pyrophosphatase [Verrucomicrobia bacterium]|nr:non-canonical purine NTP pyrophosphatase [Verrucomicrobiota bacterium]
MAQKILLATRNAHKTTEFRAILGGGWEVADLSAHPDFPEVEETGTTFAENAALKAVAASARLGETQTFVLADDSGLEVDALGGAPGVHSARYAALETGASGNSGDAANRQKLRAELTRLGVLHARPAARFRAHIAVARGGQWLAGFDGAVEGCLVPEERGSGGFGYDPLFVPVGFTQTFGELPAETKHRLSHRGAALAKAVAFLRGFI